VVVVVTAHPGAYKGNRVVLVVGQLTILVALLQALQRNNLRLLLEVLVMLEVLRHRITPPAVAAVLVELVEAAHQAVQVASAWPHQLQEHL
jgi:hypothetical protein